jgi:hypothetical protein
MGVTLIATCDQCGFMKAILFGCGMDDGDSVCRVPAINIKTGKFIVKNIRDPKVLKLPYRFYNDKRMFQGEITDDDFESNGITLKYYENLCPNCKTFTLNFQKDLPYD